MPAPNLSGEHIVSVFGWVAEHCEPPPRWDLRRIGWKLSADPAGRHVRLIDARTGGAAEGDRSLCLFVGVDCGRERARLLDAGCGDALPATVDLPELAQRAHRVAAAGGFVSRLRAAGPLTLDLLHRDARAGDRWLALHPREFALLWRLAERPGERVSRSRLLRDVWRLEFEPGTNSIEVHVSRLRAKLAAAGIAKLVETDPPGGYRVSCSVEAACGEPFEPRLCA
jgi:DNA-binding winged helix-turn-helix (wHTH) protein